MWFWNELSLLAEVSLYSQFIEPTCSLSYSQQSISSLCPEKQESSQYSLFSVSHTHARNILPSMHRPYLKFTPSFIFSYSNLVCTSLPCQLHAHPPHCSYNYDNIWWAEQIVKSLIIQISPTSWHFLKIRSKLYCYCPVLRLIQPVFTCLMCLL
jgi:hypothetical protein